MKFGHCLVLLTWLGACAPAAWSQQLEANFSCSTTRSEDGQPVLYADTGRIKFDGSRIDAFRWESSLFRRTHGFDCSIDEADGLNSEVRDQAGASLWRVTLADALGARVRRGYDFVHGLNCSIRIQRHDDLLSIIPSCPALCGSRPNFSEFSVDLKTGTCRYQE